MPAKNQTDSAIGQILDIASKNKKICAVYIFGSYIKNKKNARDIDICIISNGLSNAQMAKLSLGFPSKSQSLKPLDISFMQKMPNYIAMRVFREGNALLINDGDALSQAWLSVVRPYLRYQPMRERIYAGVKKWMNSAKSQTASKNILTTLSR